MSTQRVIGGITSIGNVFVALSLLSGLLWWRASVVLLLACAVSFGLAHLLSAFVNGRETTARS